MVASNLSADEVTPDRDWRYYVQEKVLVIFFLGFSAGLPLPLIYATLSAWLFEAGLPNSTISTFAFLMFAYSLKFIWSPIVDAVRLPVLTRRLGRRRAWLLSTQVAIAFGLLALAQVDPAEKLLLFTFVAALVAWLSATQDIVLDAYRVELAGVEMQGVLAASYQYGYRVAIVVSGAGALYLAEFGSWQMSYSVMAACMAIGILTTLYCKEPENIAPPVYHFSGSLSEKTGKWLMAAVVGPVADFFRRYGFFALTILSFMAMFRISDYVLGILANPFYLDVGFTKSQVASVAKLYGLWVALIGIGAGGWAILKFGLSSCLISAATLIATTNLFFAVLAVTGPDLWVLAMTISFDNFAQGFAGTVFIAYLSSLTNISFTATQYALFSSLSVFIGKLAAGFSGEVQEWIGWVGFFLYAAAVGVPSIILSVIVVRQARTSGGTT
ncbi:MAG TPA: MFS transporter [Woeseiaceae bacterium]|jgi:PAT family beta-lactamase induction signal transducer AmpG